MRELGDRVRGIGVPTAESASIAGDMRRAAEKLRERGEQQIGSVVRNPYVVHNARVLAGTRIPTQAIWNFHEAGYSADAIIREYPRLTPPDVRAAIEPRTSCAVTKSKRDGNLLSERQEVLQGKGSPRHPGGRAYRAGERIRDERSSDVYNFCDRHDIAHKEILLPPDLGTELRNELGTRPRQALEPNGACRHAPKCPVGTGDSGSAPAGAECRSAGRSGSYVLARDRRQVSQCGALCDPLPAPRQRLASSPCSFANDHARGRASRYWGANIPGAFGDRATLARTRSLEAGLPANSRALGSGGLCSGSHPRQRANSSVSSLRSCLPKLNGFPISRAF
jgi:uncharacterized protein (DUF433 family)